MLGLFRRFVSITLKIGVLAGGIGVIIAYANLSDLDGWKDDLQDRIMSVSGRRLHIDGPIDFEVSMPPRIVARGIRLQNAPWGSKKDMLKARALVAEVDFLPLMLGDVAVPRLRLVGADILVEIGKSGRTNWDELDAFNTAAGGAASGPNIPVLSPAINSGISIAGGTLTVSNTATGVVTTIPLPTAGIDLVGGLPCL